MLRDSQMILFASNVGSSSRNSRSTYRAVHDGITSIETMGQVFACEHVNPQACYPVFEISLE